MVIEHAHRVLSGFWAEDAKSEGYERRDDEHDEHGVLERTNEELLIRFVRNEYRKV